MKNIIEKIKNWISQFYNKKRFLYFTILSNGLVVVKKIIYTSENKQWKFLSERNLGEFLEKDFFQQKVNRMFFKFLFFPFKYQVIINIPHSYCRSKYFQINHKRNSSKSPISEGEMTLIFSNYLLKLLDSNKKEVLEKNGFDELNILLVDHKVIDSSIDGKRFFPQSELVMDSLGKDLKIGMVHTFLYRPISSGFNKMLPSRAKVWGYFEDGFNLPLGLHLNYQNDPKTKNKKSLFAIVKEEETHIYQDNLNEIKFFDTFGFGYKNIYNALNNALGIQYEEFFILLQKLAKQDMSPSTMMHILRIIEVELQRLYNGLLLFKKEFGSLSIYLDAGPLTEILRNHKRFSPMLICDEWKMESSDDFNGLNISKNNIADLMYGSLSKSNILNSLSAKHIRWLIPYNINS